MGHEEQGGLSRRELLRRAGLLGAAVALGGPAVACSSDEEAGSGAGSGDDAGDDAGSTTTTRPAPEGGAATFTHGVASGDPLTDSVILWTRVTVDGLTHDGAPVDEVDVAVQVATDPELADVVAELTATTDATVDHTVKIEATGLEPGTTYYYRFTALQQESPVGRTRTLPDGEVDRLRFAVCSCSNYAFGYFYAYRHLARRPDLDAVIHLGDYIYEYANPDHGETYGEFRELDPPHEILAVDDYRRRYAQYRADADLAEVHRQNAMIHLWDDHEFADDPIPGGAANHQPDIDGDWQARVAAALQAYTEWMPTRLGAEGRIYRTFAFGDLAQLTLVDRQRRYLWPAEADGDLYLGAEQADWLDAEIEAATAPWLLLGTASWFGPHGPTFEGSGGWDPPSRDRVLDGLEANGADLVVLTGDVHRAEALDVVRDPEAYDPATGGGSVGVELSTSSITSPGGGAEGAGPQLRWNNGLARGYLVLDVTPERAQGDWFGFNDFVKTAEDEPDESWIGSWAAAHGARRLEEAEALEGRADAPPLAPG